MLFFAMVGELQRQWQAKTERESFAVFFASTCYGSVMAEKAAPPVKKPRHTEATSRYDFWAPFGLCAAVLLFSVYFVGSQMRGVDNDRSVQFVQMGLVVVAFAVIYWGIELARENRPLAYQRLRDRLLLTLGFSAFLAYFNFGHMHFGARENTFDIHIWDTYHYYMGAKYFPEVGYDNLYECAAVADVESGRREEVERRVMTELKTNLLIRASEVFERPDRCKRAFSEARWKAFKVDINLFRGWVSESRWMEIHKDHGYNATPVWTLAGHWLSNTAAASREQIVMLILLDPIYLALSALLVWWAFGPRGFALAMFALGTNFPNRYWWTGGAFLRHDWLFYLIAAICLLKKDKAKLAGAAFAYTVLLRLFPGLAALGSALAAAASFRLHRLIDRQFVRFVVSGVATAIVLVTVSVVGMGGVESWQRFSQNTVKHANTPLTNHMGLRTILSYRLDSVGTQLTDSTEIDAWGAWKQARLDHWSELKPLFVALMLAALVAIYAAVKASGAAQYLGLALGVGLIVFGAELTCYYYCFLAGMALLAAERREVGLVITCLSAVTLLVEMGGFSGQSHQLDEQYVVMSAASVLAVSALWWLFSPWGKRIALPAEPAFSLGLERAAAVVSSPASARKKK
jgi:hypothetical protein